ncbi:MAG: tRNA (adenosine(37)-N6)-threonylcarbamoyltransferase complex dimerization subunit type 1 TsaB [Deltaproteobacteria bacterium]|nr:tRNA (adenosine(37)-N6)-threonylcarbamoyltransferase complex dimerization subunit type 1 TsaB [Deltaproteobacteria bacterium]MBI2342674.1 tRNA (adenosine(37)-N6)-threonylcarbamoyltransferase complex dimerization subunit type 1 TsaB [Deltaproteobacteria bacterium]MBI2974187.1 tRNA (adenosine(37)-N6)-threonylcarbamoyltransferase complex dimerization subunit type 1 TsaB [Deltaproteobacteria bacterium]
MKVLSFDTSTSSGSVSVLDNFKVVAADSYLAESSHAEILFNVIDKILESSGLKIADVDAIGVAIGPGSFTGLRIGLAAAKGLARANNKALVGVSSLEAIACGLPEKHPDKIIVPCIDAKRGEVYASAYEAGEKCPSAPLPSLQRIVDESSFSPDQLCAILEKFDLKCLFAGSGADRYRDLFTSKMAGKFNMLSENISSAVNIGLIASEKFKNGLSDDVALLAPNYIRPSAAEQKRNLRG